MIQHFLENPMIDSLPSSSKPSSRLLSLDAFRGLTMISMIMVNNPGSWDHIYPPLEHAEWHGFTFTDLIFPSFLFIVGVSMAFSFARRLELSDTKHLHIQIIRRTLIILALGLFLNIFSFFNDGNYRIPGVLQRIAICYFFVGLMAVNVKTVGFWIAGTSLLVIYSIGMLLIPVPGYGAGSFDPQGNFCWMVDRALLWGHTWRFAPAEGFDPEGVWSTLPAIVTTLLGYRAGLMLRSEREQNVKLISLFLRGSVCLLTAYLTTAFMPINKQLWTVPYVFLAAGIGLHLLGLLYYLIDLHGYQKVFIPAVIYGSNAIFIYVGSDVVIFIMNKIKLGSGDAQLNLFDYLYEHVFLHLASPINASLAMALTYVLFWLVISSVLYRMKIFIKI
jgi:predicted acyltransferase